MNKKESQHQPLSPLRYAVVSFIAFVIGTVLLLFFILKADDLIAQGISEKVFYVLLLPLGLSASAFLFGAMRSYAHYKGKQLGGILELGGPVVLFIIVVAGGFKLVPDTSSFSLTVYVHGSQGRQDMALRNEGKVIIDLGNDRRIKDIGSQGEVHFSGIPARFRNQQVSVTIDAQGFEVVDSNKLYRLNSSPLYVAVKRDDSLSRVSGIVRDEEYLPLKDVTIRIGSVKTTTNEDGYFTLTIPLEQQKPQQTLTAFRQGYELWEEFVYPETGQEVKIILIKKR
jgi:hypothetical protein